MEKGEDYVRESYGKPQHKLNNIVIITFYTYPVMFFTRAIKPLINN